MSASSPRLSVISGWFLLFTLLLAALYALSGSVPFLRAHLTEIYAVGFLFLPHVWHGRTGFPIPDFGALPRGLLFGIAISVLVIVIFSIAYIAYFYFLCKMHWQLWPLGRTCAAWHAFAFPGWQKTGHLFLIHAIAVALPEEYFYRGFLLPLAASSRTLSSLPENRRLAAALFVQAVFFALGHVLVDFNPMRFSVFFPGLLFGWLTLASRGLWAPILLHAVANVLSETLEAGFFG